MFLGSSRICSTMTGVIWHIAAQATPELASNFPNLEATHGTDFAV